jgi:hypothetical protein
MNAEEMNRRVSEIAGLWDFNSCPDCQAGNMWAYEIGGCWSPECNIRPLPFLTSPEAAWKLLDWWRQTENGLQFVRAFWNDPLNFGKPDLMKALVEAVIAAEGEKG